MDRDPLSRLTIKRVVGRSTRRVEVAAAPCQPLGFRRRDRRPEIGASDLAFEAHSDVAEARQPQHRVEVVQRGDRRLRWALRFDRHDPRLARLVGGRDPPEATPPCRGRILLVDSSLIRKSEVPVVPIGGDRPLSEIEAVTWTQGSGIDDGIGRYGRRGAHHEIARHNFGDHVGPKRQRRFLARRAGR